MRVASAEREGRERLHREQIRQWLDRSRSITSACDLDLVLFFARHSRALLTTDQIAAFVGYDAKRVNDGVERLVAARFVGREHTDRPAALYCLTAFGGDDDPLLSLIDMASTREGRLAVIDALRSRPRAARGPANRRGAPALRLTG